MSRISRLMVVPIACGLLGCPGGLQAAEGVAFEAGLQPRLERALDRWCHWLSGYLYQIPGTDLYTLNPTLGTGRGPYRDVAGNQFAAAAAGYWLARAKPEEAVAKPLQGLIKLALGTHVAVKAIDRPDIQRWGASLSSADDWHADLFAGAQGMLLNGALPQNQQNQLLKILEWEADKQVEFGISKAHRTMPGLWPAESCGESNAWSCALLQTARWAMPGSSRQPDWRKTAVAYCANAISLPADMQSEEKLGGRMLKELVKGANFQPGGIQEHHGFYHPGYEGWVLAYMAYAFTMDEQLPEAQRDADVYLHNWKRVYDRLKQSTLSKGRFVYAAGYDWIAYGYGNTQFMPAALFAASHFGDADASAMVNGWLTLIEKQQEVAGGSVQASRLASFQRFRVNDFSWYEAQEGCCLAQALWMLEHMKGGRIPEPATEQEFNQRNVATYHEPEAHLAWYRDEAVFASAAWRAAHGQWQLLVQPVQLPHLLKFNHNGMGILQISGATPSVAVESSSIGTFAGGGFWTIGSIARDSKNVVHGRPDNKVAPLARQYEAMVVLPHGPTLLVDYCQALDQLWLLHDGSLGLRLAADVFNEQRVRIEANGTESAWTPGECDDLWQDLQSRSVVVERQLTISALSGEGTFQLMRKRQRPASGDMLYPSDILGVEESLLSHELYFAKPSQFRPRMVGPQEWFRQNVLALSCEPRGVGHATTGTVRGTFPCLLVDLPESKCTVGINFDGAARSVEVSGVGETLEPNSVGVFSWPTTR